MDGLDEQITDLGPGINERTDGGPANRSAASPPEAELRDDFDQQAFHDSVLGQRLLPPDILKHTVMTEFVPSQIH